MRTNKVNNNKIKFLWAAADVLKRATECWSSFPSQLIR